MTVSKEDFQKRIDESMKRAIQETAPVVPLHAKKPRVVKPLEKVAETPPPEKPYYHPFKTEQEFLDATKEDTEKREVILDNEDIRKGRRPIGRNWWKWAAAGVGAAVLAYFQGC